MKRFWILRASLALCALELVFFADRLPPFLVQGLLLLLALLPLLAERTPAAGCWSRREKPALIVFSVLLQGALYFAGFYFSDDALRHLHEGDAILRGIDVYALPPRAWPSWLDHVPVNWEHSHIASVYFPFTQLLSTAGAFLSPLNGYILLFHAIAAGLCSALIVLGRRPRLLPAFLLSPAFVLISAGRHEDLIGALAFLLCMELLARAKRSRSAWKTEIMAGALAGTLCFIKPDGIIPCAVFLLALRRRAFLSGAFLAAGFFIWFSAVFLWHGSGTIFAFFTNLRLFAQGYTGYNPLSVYAPGLWEAAGRPALILAGLFFFVRGWFSGGKGLLSGIAGLLVCSVLVRGVWHPWYFVWLSVFLLWQRRPGGLELLGVLSLFYIPVADLRAGSGFHFEKFYVALGIWLILWALDKFLTVRKFRRL